MEAPPWGLLAFSRQTPQPGFDIHQLATHQIGAETLHDLFHEGVFLSSVITTLTFIGERRLIAEHSATGTYYQAQTTSEHRQTGIRNHTLLFGVG